MCACADGYQGPDCSVEMCGEDFCPQCQQCINDQCVPNDSQACDNGPFEINEMCMNGICNGTIVCEEGVADCPPCDPLVPPMQCRHCVDGYQLPDPNQVGQECDDCTQIFKLNVVISTSSGEEK